MSESFPYSHNEPCPFCYKKTVMVFMCCECKWAKCENCSAFMICPHKPGEEKETDKRRNTAQGKGTI